VGSDGLGSRRWRRDVCVGRAGATEAERVRGEAAGRGGWEAAQVARGSREEEEARAPRGDRHDGGSGSVGGFSPDPPRLRLGWLARDGRGRTRGSGARILRKEGNSASLLGSQSSD
jgi:hypothetical protein